MDKYALERARGCMTAAGLFFKPGAEDISQVIELGLRTEEEPIAIYESCTKRTTADKSVLAMTSLMTISPRAKAGTSIPSSIAVRQAKSIFFIF